MNAERMLVYTPMSLMRRRYSVRSLQKSNARSVLRIMDCWSLLHFTSVSYIYLLESDTQAACDTEGTSMHAQLGSEHEINLRDAPYELVPEYFVNSLLVLMTRPRKACAFAQSHHSRVDNWPKVLSLRILRVRSVQHLVTYTKMFVCMSSFRIQLMTSSLMSTNRVTALELYIPIITDY